MQAPMMAEVQRVAADTYCLGAHLPIPGLGVLAVNAFLLTGREPMLIDTGLGALRSDFLQALSALVDPAELRWIWLTHMDADHIGNLEPLLAAAPQAQVVTSFLGMGKMMLQGGPTERVHRLEPGGQLIAGDRRLTALRPPVFDAPETMGLYDEASGALFPADCFGALLDGPADSADDIPAARLREGMLTWAAIDAPWLKLVEPARFGECLRAVERLQPGVVLSGHLAPAFADTARLLSVLGEAVGEPAPAA